MPDNETSQVIKEPWTLAASEALERLDVSPEEGLGDAEIEKRRAEYGRNQLRQAETKSVWAILIGQFKSLIVLLLVIAAAVSFAFGETVEGIAITAVIVINAGIGFFTELQAIRSMEALQELSSVEATVRRDGQVVQVPAEELVPGDMAVVAGGDVVTADIRLTEMSKLQANEATLTGESLPVSKQVEPLAADTILAERTNMLFKGTAVTRGSGEGVVVATGMDTELGHTSDLVAQAEEAATPLEERLEQLGQRLIYATLAMGTVVIVSGILVGKDILLMVETGIALAVASIPEGLPIVTTVALARGMWRMAKRNALINRLSAVETLGSTNVILTDKTGTLTEGQMTATRARVDSGTYKLEQDDEADPSDDPLLRQAAQIGVLCNDATLSDDDDTAVGDPTEIALLMWGRKMDMERPSLLEEMPEEREVAFDPEVKMMATFHRDEDGYRVAVKGALEQVLDRSTHTLTQDDTQEMDDEQRQRWQQAEQEMAAEGLRIMALAYKNVDDPETDPYNGLTFVGLVGLSDPPRQDIEQAIASSHDAGIQVIMVTGDQPTTARSIAQEIGIISDRQADVMHGNDFRPLDEMDESQRDQARQVQVMARFSPKQKLDLITLHQQTGAIVAMTGDGVNDAPALKKADIGIAMGQRGTQVAKEASDMILQDDAFSTIVVAIEQGRVIFDNIRKFVLYLLSCNVAEVMIVGIAALINAPLPIRPLQILFLNLVTDVFPALALGAGEGERDVLERAPRRPDAPIMDSGHWRAIGGYGALITMGTLGAFALALRWLQMPTGQAVTVSFLTLAFAQLWHVFDMRGPRSSLIDNDVTRNPYIWGALGLCIGLLLAATYVPFLADILQIVPPGPSGWLIILALSLAPSIVGQIIIEIAKAKRSHT